MCARHIAVISTLLLSTACSTLGDSLKLGASLGAVGGLAAAYSAHSSNGLQPSLETLAAGAGLGLVAGLITSHAVYRSVEEDRKVYQTDQVEMHFGDLPPSPFIMPKPMTKKGSRP